ncbi:DUF6000 family protein [Streptomyces sp. NPDC060235]|uniref:DUF6000 family protein n=1 Tax=Streptomyces sp. NPDC060235 TaxID=3347080 RepID=UPI0036482AFD
MPGVGEGPWLPNCSRTSLERTRLLQSLRLAAEAITDEELEVRVDRDWRSRLTAAWLTGLDRRQPFRDVPGDLLLARRLYSSRQGYCFALTRFCSEEDALYLKAHVERYLQQPDCQCDQYWATSTLLHIDRQGGTEHVGRLLAPGGLRHQWNDAQFKPCRPARSFPSSRRSRRGSNWRMTLLGTPSANARS